MIDTDSIKPIFEKHAVERAWLFGSYLKGDFRRWSDVDIFVQMRGDKFALRRDLENELQKRVDLISRPFNGWEGEEKRLIYP